MKVGDLIKVGFAEGNYHGILLGFYPYKQTDKAGDYRILFRDGEVILFSQDTLDWEGVTMELVSESR